MAKANSTLKSTTYKAPARQPNQRFYTIDYVPQSTKPNSRPQLIIKGKWLERIRFYVGCPVIVKIKQDKLVIEIDLQV